MGMVSCRAMANARAKTCVPCEATGTDPGQRLPTSSRSTRPVYRLDAAAGHRHRRAL